MSDIKLFSIEAGDVRELSGKTLAIEKSLQTLMEKHLEHFLNVRFIASEYMTGKTHGGRIDTLGIDENGCPVIIEYKRSTNENVINQGLYYLDWLMDHRGEFKLLVMKQLGNDAAENIEWSSPRLLCVAGDFTRYDEHAVQQINRNIELIRYRRYGDTDGLLLLELVNAGNGEPFGNGQTSGGNGNPKAYKTFVDYLAQSTQAVRDRYECVKTFLLGLGEDVQIRQLKYYVAFRRFSNFACVEVRPQSGDLLIYARIDPATVAFESDFTRDVSNIGHFGTGDVEIRLHTDEDLERAKSLLTMAYQVS